MKRHGPRIVTGVLLGVLLLSGWKAARASAALALAPRQADRTGLAETRSTRVRAPAGSPMAEIGRVERAIVFIYSPDCAVSHANMSNWVDLVGELRGGGGALYAVAPVQTPAAKAYWGGLARHVRVITAHPKDVHTTFDVDNTPVTLLVRNGVVRARVTGSLTPAAMRQVRAFARTGAI